MQTITLGTAMMRHPTLSEDEVLPDTIEPRIQEAEPLLAEAAARGCDFMCLPELFADPSQGTKMVEFAEEAGGPVATRLSQKAREHGMAIVSTIAQREGDRVFNAGLIHDKEGALVGCYRKVHLPPGECDVATPGDGFPVFEVGPLRIGMQICHDLYFPEGCRILAINGADLVFWPNMWGGMPEEHSDLIMKTRAIENGLCLISSAYLLSGDSFFRVPKIHGRSCIIDWSGSILAEVGRRLGIATATIDLAELSKQTEHRRNTLLRERLPSLYGEIAQAH